MLFSACNATIPQIGNGTVNITGSDIAPYFLGERVIYQCNANFSETETNLTNICDMTTMNMGGSVDWTRSEENLANVCQPGIFKM